MGTGQEAIFLLIGFGLAGVMVAYWRAVLALLAVVMLGLTIVGALQVAHWFQAL